MAQTKWVELLFETYNVNVRNVRRYVCLYQSPRLQLDSAATRWGHNNKLLIHVNAALRTDCMQCKCKSHDRLCRSKDDFYVPHCKMTWLQYSL